MEVLLRTQLATLVAFFVTMLVACLLPLKLVSRREKAASSPPGSAYVVGLALANCFSAGVFLATFFVGLLPDVRRQVVALLDERRIATFFPATEFVVVLGFFVSLFAEQLLLLCRRTRHDSSVQQQHGHSHQLDLDADVDGSGGNDRGSGRACMLLLSLSVHSLFEGVTLGLQSRVPQLLRLFGGVLLHECLVALAVGVTLARARLSARAAVQLATAFAVVIPVGQALGIALAHRSSSPTSASTLTAVTNVVLQALAAGTFVHVTFLEMIPEGLGVHGTAEDESSPVSRLLSLGAGFVLLAVLPLVVPEGLDELEEEASDDRRWWALLGT